MTQLMSQDCSVTGGDDALGVKLWLTCSKGLLHFSGDGEGLVGAALEHCLQLGDQHDRLQRSHLSSHQLAHTQLVAHHALMRLQCSLQLQGTQVAGCIDDVCTCVSCAIPRDC